MFNLRIIHPSTIYSNKHYRVDRVEGEYRIINKESGYPEAVEKVLPQALFKADGMSSALDKFYAAKDGETVESTD